MRNGTPGRVVDVRTGPTAPEGDEIGPEVAKATVNAEAAVRRLGVLWRSVARVYDETMAHRYGVVQ
jgi:hypothetical protein